MVFRLENYIIIRVDVLFTLIITVDPLKKKVVVFIKLFLVTLAWVDGYYAAALEDSPVRL